MFEEFLYHTGGWLSAEGPDSDVVVSSRIRLARNIDGYPFPQRAGAEKKEGLRQRLAKVFTEVSELKDASLVKMEELDSVDKQFLLERHLISQEHIHPGKGKGVLVSASETVSIMVNEEDHLRMQILVSGADLWKAWEEASRIDDSLSELLPFSFLPDLGYLTSCPTNVGTALRASCMLHLPALVITKRINKILELLAKLSFTTRGLFGEGTQALGNFFQISNQVTLGLAEEEIIDNLTGVVRQVKEQEMDARRTLMKKYPYKIEDSIWRSWGILTNCRMISTKEAFSHLSMLWLGCSLGMFKELDIKLITQLFIFIQPAHLQKQEGKKLGEEERDYIRAQIVRGKLIKRGDEAF